MREVSSKSEFETILASKKYVMVDFYAQWCGPCKKISPEIEKVNEMYKNISFLKVDVDNLDEIATKYKVKAMPTFLFFLNGDVKFEVVGAKLELIKDTLNKLSSL